MLKQAVFASNIYTIAKPEYLGIVNTVAEEFLANKREKHPINELYPVCASDNINYDPRVLGFANFVAQSAWDILAEQGYLMEQMRTYFGAMWCQEHHKHSMMEQHTHGDSAQIVGFYFLNAPENCSRALFHNPAVAKNQINLPQADVNNLTDASIMMNVPVQEGLLVFSNSWVPHSFTRNGADEPLKFIHFNVNVAPVERQFCAPAAEVV